MEPEATTSSSESSACVPSDPSPSSFLTSPLVASYTYHSPKPTAAGPYILGVDEAGRGPVLGPMVYGVAYCPAAWKADLEELGFADSKTLSHDARSQLLEILSSSPENLGWSVRVICPQAISAGMLRRPPLNLNRQAEEATVLLIREVLKSGLQLSEVYVDALGPSPQYQAYLSSVFPGIDFTVTPKADSKYKIVGAASVAAKVTRDAWVDGWLYEEDVTENDDGELQASQSSWPNAERKDDPSTAVADAEAAPAETAADEIGGKEERLRPWGVVIGSGYPADPKTKAWLASSLEPTFGYPALVRFSWTTVKVVLDRDAHDVKWIDEGQESLVKAFESSTGRERDRCAVARELGIQSVGML